MSKEAESIWFWNLFVNEADELLDANNSCYEQYVYIFASLVPDKNDLLDANQFLARVNGGAAEAEEPNEASDIMRMLGDVTTKYVLRVNQYSATLDQWLRNLGPRSRECWRFILQNFFKFYQGPAIRPFLRQERFDSVLRQADARLWSPPISPVLAPALSPAPPLPPLPELLSEAPPAVLSLRCHPDAYLEPPAPAAPATPPAASSCIIS